MTEIILILVIILLIYCCYSSKSRVYSSGQKYIYPQDGSFYAVKYDPTAMYGTTTSQNGSIRELELDNTTRGVVPIYNQPNHTANMWKSDTSQTNDGAVNEIAFDWFRPMGNNVVNMDVDDSSRMHITSRFAGAKS